MVLKDYNKYEQEGAKQMLQRCVAIAGKENVVERLHAMRDYALRSLETGNLHDCADVLDDILPFFSGLIGDVERDT